MSNKNQTKGIVLGILLLVCLHVVAVFLISIVGFAYGILGYAIGSLLLVLIFLLGLVQLIYLIPVIIILRWRRRWAVMKGVIICAAITLLLNIGGWILYLYLLWK